jgi:hypothetical protein
MEDMNRGGEICMLIFKKFLAALSYAAFQNSVTSFVPFLMFHTHTHTHTHANSLPHSKSVL